MNITARFMGLILYLEQKATALEDCQFRFYLVNWKKEYHLPGQPDENLKSNTEAQPQVTWNCCWQLGSIDSRDSTLLFTSFIAMIWSDQQYVADTKASGTENWQVHKAEIPRFSGLHPILERKKCHPYTGLFSIELPKVQYSSILSVILKYTLL